MMGKASASESWNDPRTEKKDRKRVNSGKPAVRD